MTNILLDTNIILNIIRADDFRDATRFVNPENLLLYISVVSEAEIRSIALRGKWGTKRLTILDYFLDKVHIIDVNKPLVSIYSEIDAYSQRLNPNFQNYGFDTPATWVKMICG